jgi:hypothetical protein
MRRWKNIAWEYWFPIGKNDEIESGYFVSSLMRSTKVFEI